MCFKFALLQRYTPEAIYSLYERCRIFYIKVLRMTNSIQEKTVDKTFNKAQISKYEQLKTMRYNNYQNYTLRKQKKKDQIILIFFTFTHIAV